MLTLALLPVLLATLDLATASPSLRNKNKQKRDDTWGGALSLGPTTSHILSATTIFIPGTAPSTQAGDLFLWPGMSNGTGDLIQTTIESWPDSSDGTYGNAWCGATAGQWCLETGLFGSFGQLSGDLTPAVDGDTNILINYTRNADGINWTQTASNAKTGALLSQFVHESGPMTGWGTGTECDDNCTGTIEEQRYLNTTITLASADFDFKSTLGVSGGTTYTGLTVSTDGTVLTIDEIVVPAMDP